MEHVSVVGLDLATSVFQGHGVNAQGEAFLRRKLTRSQLLKLFEKLPPPCRDGSVRLAPPLGA